MYLRGAVQVRSSMNSKLARSHLPTLGCVGKAGVVGQSDMSWKLSLVKNIDSCKL